MRLEPPRPGQLRRAQPNPLRPPCSVAPSLCRSGSLSLSLSLFSPFLPSPCCLSRSRIAAGHRRRRSPALCSLAGAERCCPSAGALPSLSRAAAARPHLATLAAHTSLSSQPTLTASHAAAPPCLPPCRRSPASPPLCSALPLAMAALLPSSFSPLSLLFLLSLLPWLHDGMKTIDGNGRTAQHQGQRLGTTTPPPSPCVGLVHVK